MKPMNRCRLHDLPPPWLADAAHEKQLGGDDGSLLAAGAGSDTALRNDLGPLFPSAKGLSESRMAQVPGRTIHQSRLNCTGRELDWPLYRGAGACPHVELATELTTEGNGSTWQPAALRPAQGSTPDLWVAASLQVRARTLEHCTTVIRAEPGETGRVSDTGTRISHAHRAVPTPKPHFFTTKAKVTIWRKGLSNYFEDDLGPETHSAPPLFPEATGCIFATRRTWTVAVAFVLDLHCSEAVISMLRY
ncbi:hypothetical protein BKA62DRAFT_123039 [Auriculariales sp. MPI-PUGE-AT-0066]|nr:hypothetical protein BKA62DRAFT_123039 [Auriculariales sp. MPI-PUGE-AT-0066]